MTRHVNAHAKFKNPFSTRSFHGIVANSISFWILRLGKESKRFRESHLTISKKSCKPDLINYWPRWRNNARRHADQWGSIIRFITNLQKYPLIIFRIVIKNEKMLGLKDSEFESQQKQTFILTWTRFHWDKCFDPRPRVRNSWKTWILAQFKVISWNTRR